MLRKGSPKERWCEELTHWKRLWCWEGLGTGGKGDDRGWDGWMASPTQWTWVEWTPGDGDGQGGLACCGSWGCKESDTTERLNWIVCDTECLFLCYWSSICLWRNVSLDLLPIFDRVVCLFVLYWAMKVKVKSLSHVRLFVTPWTVAYQAPLSMGFSRQ